MEIMKTKLDKGCFALTKAHETDAGYDLRSPIDIEIPSHGRVFIDTGVHIELPKGCVGMLKSKSGLNKNYHITSTGGVIDEGYTGSIGVILRNESCVGYKVKKGDKIVQLVIIKYESPSLKIVQELDKTDRGDGGFGSSGR